MQQYKQYSAIKTGYEHLNTELLMHVPDHMKD